jgi:hypothetical protein
MHRAKPQAPAHEQRLLPGPSRHLAWMERWMIRFGRSRQREPIETAPATEKTEVRILYDARHVYFGIHCYDPAPAEIVATQLRRDLSMDLDDNLPS